MILERLLYSFVSSVVSAAVSSFGRIKFNKIAMIVATTTEEEPKILLIHPGSPGPDKQSATCVIPTPKLQTYQLPLSFLLSIHLL